MADWDPFAIDAAEEAAGPVPHSNGEKVKLTDRDIERIVEEAYDKTAVAYRAMDISNAGKPDLSVHQPSGPNDPWPHSAILLEFGHGIAYIVLNRPAENNVMDEAFSAAWADVVFRLHNRPDIRIVVLVARGSIFSAGGELGLPASNPSAEVKQARDSLFQRALASGSCPDEAAFQHALGAKALWNFHSLPQTTVALVTGSVFGGALGLVCACDTVISMRSALFVTSEVKQGTVPALSAPYLCAKVGLGRAKKNFSQGLSRTAMEARADGIVQYIIDEIREADSVIQDLCTKVSELPPGGVTKAKQMTSVLSGRSVDMYSLAYTMRVHQALMEEVRQDPNWANDRIEPLDLAQVLGID
mmetsp:Transcript_26694/g.48949  ORF Transcript_26694/g.48949 Transcript_26694/m.48949 type:complete len:358 (-) Transcript_26694:96-1169(-)